MVKYMLNFHDRVCNVQATDRRRRYGVMGRNLALNIAVLPRTPFSTAPVKDRRSGADNPGKSGALLHGERFVESSKRLVVSC